MRDQVKSLVVYDCSKTEMGKIYSLMDTMECPEAYPTYVRTRENERYYLYQESNFRRAQVKECIVKKVTFVFHCGKWSHSSMIMLKAIPRPLEIDSVNCGDVF